MNTHHVAKRVGINTFWLLLGRLGSQGLMIVFTIVIARRLGEVGLGQYSLMAAVIFAANTLSTFGTDLLIIREIASTRNYSFVMPALVMQLGISLLLMSVVFITAPMLPNQSSEATVALQIYSFALFPLSVYTVLGSVLRGKERMDLFAFLSVTVMIIQVIGTLLIIQINTSIIALSLMLLGIQIIAAVLAIMFSLSSLSGIIIGEKLSSKSILKLMRSSYPIALFGFVSVVYQKLSLYSVSTLSGAALAGWFSATLRIVEAPKVAHVALLGALYPTMSQAKSQQYNVQNIASSSRVFSLSWKVLILIAGLLTVILFLFAEPVILLIYGSRFLPSVTALKILAWIFIPFTVSQYLSIRFLAIGEENKIVFALIISILVLTSLCMLWIPKWGIVGASWATLVAETVQAAIFLRGWNKIRRGI